MRIGMDARKDRDGGIGRYILNLMDGLTRAEGLSRLHAWLKPDSPLRRRHPPRVYPHVERAGFYTIWEQISLGRKVRRVDLDVFHAPHYVVPFFLNVPLVVTIHDLIHLIFPKSPLHVAYARKQIAYAVAHAKKIITPSDFSRRELLRFFPESAGKTHPILHGIEAFFSPGRDEADSAISRDLYLPDSFIFYVGNHKPHKNLSQLIPVCRELFNEFPDLTLCLTGNREDEKGRVWQTARRLGVEQRIRFLGTLNNVTLRACYRLARVFVFPSLYEGFGFPPLEAMACGTPVVAFRAASLPEVVGEGGWLVPPGDGKAFYQAVARLLGDPEAWRAWSNRGKKQAARFQWGSAIEKHLQVYREAVSVVAVQEPSEV